MRSESVLTDLPPSVSHRRNIAVWRVRLVRDTSGATPTLTKSQTGTFRITGISDKSVAVSYYNDEGTTQVAVDAGVAATQVGQTRTANWSLYARKPGAAASALEFQSTQNLAAVNISAGASVSMAANGSRALVVNGLSVATGGTLDMKDNDLIVHATSATRDAVYADLYDWIVSGFNGGAWNGSGLTSTVARDNTNGDTALGIAKNVDLNYTTFANQAVNSDSILIKYTYYCDFDLDGDVDGDDEAALVSGFGKQNAYWVDGDTDYNNIVDGDDFAVLASNFGKSGL